MGKKIDRFVLTLAAAGAFYFYYRNAFHSRMLAIALALLSCAVAVKLLSRLLALAGRAPWMQRRRIRKSAGSAVMRLACMPRAEALEQLEALLRESYGGAFAVELIQAHPSTNLSQDRLFETWRAHRDDERLAVCATCACDSACRMLASSLREPKLALIDAGMLAQLISEHPERVPVQDEAQRRPRLRLRRAAALLINRKNAPRCLLFSGAMLLMYLISANAGYLVSSMALLFLALASLRRANRPARLF